MRNLELLKMIRHRIRHQCEIGIVSCDPDNEDPQFELMELLPDIENAIARIGKRNERRSGQ